MRTKKFKNELEIGVFAFGEDTHTLRLKSELFDLRVGYANPRGFWPNGFQGSRAYRKIEENNGI